MSVPTSALLAKVYLQYVKCNEFVHIPREQYIGFFCFVDDILMINDNTVD